MVFKKKSTKKRSERPEKAIPVTAIAPWEQMCIHNEVGTCAEIFAEMVDFTVHKFNQDHQQREIVAHADVWSQPHK